MEGLRCSAQVLNQFVPRVGVDAFGRVAAGEDVVGGGEAAAAGGFVFEGAG